MATTMTIRVTLLSMMIAIMGDSLAHATENQTMYDLVTKLAILGKHAPLLPQTEAFIE